MTNLTLLIVVYSINVGMLLPLLIVRAENAWYKLRYNQTIYYVKRVLGWIIGLNGEIRIGKTSAMSGLKSVCEIIALQELEDYLLKVKRILKDIDFNDFNHNLNIDIQSFYEVDSEGNEHDFTDNIENSLDVLTDSYLEEYNLNPDALHFNMVGYVKVYDLIRGYVEAYWIMNYRFNFVQSKTPFYSNITASFSMNLDMEWLRINDAYSNKNYALHKYMVYLVDESTDETGASKYIEDPTDKAGAKEFRRKFGHLFQETSRMITTKQDVMDEVKKYRNLTHSNLVLEQKVTHHGFGWLHHLIASFYKSSIRMIKIFIIRPKFIGLRLLWLFRIKKDKVDMSWLEDFHLNKTGRYRKLENKLYYLEEFFKSIGYNRYVGSKLKRAEDIEKSTADKDEFVFYIPTVDCFGTYDTHYYKGMQQDLLRHSEVNSTEDNPFNRKSFFDKKIDREGDDKIEFNF